MSIAVKRAKSRNLFQLLQTREDQAHVSAPAIVGTRIEGGISLQVWAVRKPDPLVKAWVAHLKKRLKKDKSWQTDSRYCALTGDALGALQSATFAYVKIDLSPLVAAPFVEARIFSFGKGSGDKGKGDPAYSLYSCESAALVMVDTAGDAIGYAVYDLVWRVARMKSGQHELEVEVEEVWIDPAHRNKGLGRYLASMLVQDVWAHLSGLETQLPCSAIPTRIDVLYAGETFSTSGAAFLRLCSHEHELRMKEENGSNRLGNLLEQVLSFEAR